jgi:hypothetical protein
MLGGTAGPRSAFRRVWLCALMIKCAAKQKARAKETFLMVRLMIDSIPNFI